MGRANNSFTSYVGHAENTLSDERVTLPEKDLWVAVLCRAALDACGGPPQLDMNKQSNVTHLNPIYVQERVRKMILRKKGWNVDVPITSHYRQGLKKGKKRGPKKKYLTGSSYYAAKAAKGPKNFYYQDMGKKGGRPRIYNRIEP